MHVPILFAVVLYIVHVMYNTLMHGMVESFCLSIRPTNGIRNTYMQKCHRDSMNRILITTENKSPEPKANQRRKLPITEPILPKMLAERLGIASVSLTGDNIVGIPKSLSPYGHHQFLRTDLDV
jgi:hypothetical protein